MVSRGIALLFLGPRHYMGRQPHSPAAPTPKKYPIPIVQEAGWTPGPVWTGAENFSPPGLDPWAVQPVACHYTNWAIRPTPFIC